MAANLGLLRALASLWSARGSGTVTVDSGRATRALHVSRGELIAVDSSLATERLGVQLVAEGRLDPSAVEPVVEAARASNRFFGDELVARGMLSAADVAAAVDRQTTSRFDRSLQMEGAVLVQPLSCQRPTCRFPLGPALLAAFRSRLSTPFCVELLAGLAPHRRARADRCDVDALQLTGVELRCWRQLASGQDVGAVIDRAPKPDEALRFAAALIALDAFGDGEEAPSAEAPAKVRRTA